MLEENDQCFHTKASRVRIDHSYKGKLELFQEHLNGQLNTPRKISVEVSENFLSVCTELIGA